MFFGVCTFFRICPPLCTMNYVLCVNIRNGKKTYIFSSSFCTCYRNTRCSTILTNIEIVQNWKHFFLIILISSLRKRGLLLRGVPSYWKKIQLCWFFKGFCYLICFMTSSKKANYITLPHPINKYWLNVCLLIWNIFEFFSGFNPLICNAYNRRTFSQYLLIGCGNIM